MIKSEIISYLGSPGAQSFETGTGDSSSIDLRSFIPVANSKLINVINYLKHLNNNHLLNKNVIEKVTFVVVSLVVCNVNSYGKCFNMFFLNI